MNRLFITLCTIAVFLVRQNNAKHDSQSMSQANGLTNGLPLLGGGNPLSGMNGGFPGMGGSNGGLPGLNGLTSALPVPGGSSGGLLKRSTLGSHTLHLEPRETKPSSGGLDGMTGALPIPGGGNSVQSLTDAVPGAGGLSDGLPGFDGLTGSLPVLGGSDSNGGNLKMRRSTDGAKNSHLESRGMIPGLSGMGGGLPMMGGANPLSGMTGGLPGMGGSNGGLPGMNGLPGGLPLDGFMKVRRSTAIADSHLESRGMIPGLGGMGGGLPMMDGGLPGMGGSGGGLPGMNGLPGGLPFDGLMKVRRSTAVVEMAPRGLLGGLGGPTGSLPLLGGGGPIREWHKASPSSRGSRGSSRHGRRPMNGEPDNLLGLNL